MQCLVFFGPYYGAAEDTPYKWVNLAELCRQILPGVTINRIRYFTALVKPRPSDSHTRLRQEIYIRALETLPNLSVHYGHFLQSEVSMRLAAPPPNGPPFARVVKTEEKGSDVNIAISGRPLQPARPSIQLNKFAKFNRDITSEGPQSHMARSQFPPQLADAQGRTITKPTSW